MRILENQILKMDILKLQKPQVPQMGDLGGYAF
jgi:hypothetical protein